MSTNKVYVLYDGRAHTMDTDYCSVIDTAITEREARAISRDNRANGYCVDALWFEYDEETQPDGRVFIVNEWARPDLSLPARKARR